MIVPPPSFILKRVPFLPVADCSLVSCFCESANVPPKGYPVLIKPPQTIVPLSLDKTSLATFGFLRKGCVHVSNSPHRLRLKNKTEGLTTYGIPAVLLDTFVLLRVPSFVQPASVTEEAAQEGEADRDEDRYNKADNQKGIVDSEHGNRNLFFIRTHCRVVPYPATNLSALWSTPLTFKAFSSAPQQ